jgi:hypothetical protein
VEEDVSFGPLDMKLRGGQAFERAAIPLAQGVVFRRRIAGAGKFIGLGRSLQWAREYEG